GPRPGGGARGRRGNFRRALRPRVVDWKAVVNGDPHASDNPPPPPPRQGAIGPPRSRSHPRPWRAGARASGPPEEEDSPTCPPAGLGAEPRPRQPCNQRTTSHSREESKPM